MKRFISGLLSLSFLLSGLSGTSSFAQDAAVIDAPKIMTISLPETAESVGGTISSMEIDNPSLELEAAKYVASQEGMILDREGGRISSSLDGNQASIGTINQAPDMTAFQKWHNGVDRRIDWMVAHPKKVAMLVAIAPAGAYGTYWFLLTSDFMVTAGTATLGYLYGIGISIFSKQWLKFCKHGSGNLVAGLAEAVVKGISFGHWKLSPHAEVRWRRAGQILTAYMMNVGLMAAFMAIGGHFQMDWHTGATMMQLAFFGNHDVVDYQTETLESRRLRAISGPMRVGGCSVIELLAALGVEEAEYAIDAIVGVSSMAHVFNEQWQHYFTRPGARAYNGIIKGIRRVRSGTWFKKKEPCVDALTKSPAEKKAA